MGLRDLGKALLAVSALSVVVVVVRVLILLRLVWLDRGAQVGFDLSGVWKTWGGWTLLWLLTTAAGFLLLTAKRP